MMSKEPTIIELEMDELKEILRRAEAKQFNDKDYETAGTVLQSYVELVALLKSKNISMRRLRKLLFGASTEKTAAVTGDGTDSAEEADSVAASKDESPKSGKGHGRNGADAYHGAEKIEVPHESLQPGDACPECGDGTVYETARPGVLVRITGQAPVAAKVYQLQKLRCHLCGKVFTAQSPPGVGTAKYDATAGSIIALLKYGSGMPFNRMQGLQGDLGIPLPASTQWDIVSGLAKQVEPVHAELIRQAGQGDVVYNDDTTIKILELMGKRARQNALAEDSAAGNAKKQRTGLFTSGVVSTREGRRIALFFSGRKHAGENLSDVLANRAKALAPPIQMCDALSRNLPAELETIVANCLAHGRRQFVDVAESFPAECRHVLESLAVIYRNDALARKRKLSPEARLRFHQAHSGSTMENLHAWLARQFDERLVEPNSSLGGAIAYMLRHWKKLTLFLRKLGAPLDNNICERALKKAILHRKNAMFYKTENGAHVGDVFMSLIYTCQLCGANPFDYLTELQRHASALAARPRDWMPWNYRAMLTACPSSNGDEICRNAG
ncbi:MAG: IS66 family transposase [Lentisphaeria bacterium]|nr:IS66 family transposase [Lentisphaeria bacterium]